MKGIDSIRALNDVSAHRRGMFASAQSRRLCVERHTVYGLGWTVTEREE